jgi:TolA-binding protein
MRLLLILSLLSVPLSGAPPTTCGIAGDYESALCAYQQRRFDDAERQFRALIDTEEASPLTLRAHYFLARTLMKTGRFEEAQALFVRIYSLDRPFYQAWNCDFLLGECRRAQGR